MKNLKNKIEAYFFISPSIILYFIFILYPIILSILISFYDWSGYSSNIFKNFVGISNYIFIVKDAVFWIAFRNTIIFVFMNTILFLTAPMFLAIIIQFGNFKFNNILRLIIFFPAVLSPVVIGLVWRKIFISDGLLNQILTKLNLEQLAIPWLNSIYFPIWIVTFVNNWQFTGYIMVLFYAAVQSISNELIEAAEIDGAGFWKIINKIIIPLLKPTMILAVIFSIIGGFRVFDIVWVMTRGGPVHYSEVLTTLMYYYSFDAEGPNKMGVALSIAVIILLIVIIFSIVRVIVNKRQEAN